MKNITVPTRTVSFEDALRNLASRLTGKPASVLPRTQEGVVQYLADTLPSVDALAEAITKEVLARMAAVEPPTSADGSSGGTRIPRSPQKPTRRPTRPTRSPPRAASVRPKPSNRKDD